MNFDIVIDNNNQEVVFTVDDNDQDVVFTVKEMVEKVDRMAEQVNAIYNCLDRMDITVDDKPALDKLNET